MHSQDEAGRLQSRLAEIDAAKEKPEKGGAILARPGRYLSALPYLFSTDIREAFVFKNCAQATRILADFNSLLRGFSVIPQQDQSEAA